MCESGREAVGGLKANREWERVRRLGHSLGAGQVPGYFCVSCVLVSAKHKTSPLHHGGNLEAQQDAASQLTSE